MLPYQTRLLRSEKSKETAVNCGTPYDPAVPRSPALPRSMQQDGPAIAWLMSRTRVLIRGRFTRESLAPTGDIDKGSMNEGGGFGGHPQHGLCDLFGRADSS
jgi:hypothetical protein